MRGHIEDRGNGVWRLRVSGGRDPSTGRRVQVSRNVRGTRTDAKRALSALVVEVDEGQHRSTASTFAALLDAYVAARSPGWSPKTTAETKGMIARHLTPHLGHLELRRLSPSDLDLCYARLLGSGLAPSTVGRIHGVARAALGMARRWGWVTANPAEDARVPTGRTPEHHLPTVAQLSALASDIDDPGFAAYLRLAYTAGARRGEILGLRWDDLDLDAGRVTIRRAVVFDEHGLVVDKAPKGGRTRVVRIGARTVEVLRIHRAQAAEAALACGVPLAGYVFSRRPDGLSPWRPDSTSRRWRQLRARHGLDKVRLHDLRHFVISTLLAEGLEVNAVQAHAGHAQASTTLDVYGHVLVGRDGRAGEIMDGML